MSMKDTRSTQGIVVRQGEKSLYSRLHRSLARFVLWLFRVRVRYPEREPGEETTYLLCSNHISAIDPLLIAAAVSHRQAHFMGKKELFRIPILGGLFRTLGAYPVDRAGDIGAIKTSLSLLEQGNCVGMFPQGTRCKGKTPREAADKVKNGAGLLCDKTHVSVLPVCLKTKNNRLRVFRRVELIFGELVPYQTLAERAPDEVSADTTAHGRQAEYARISHAIFERICALYEEDDHAK
jgi:1-acyl-sn-glycerol-3-phosphate acyltransferase